MIGLLMIVKDESSVIARCLASVKPLISHWTIVDTGSTDDTRDIVADTLDGIPGRLLERPWQSFDINLTEALAEARGTAQWLLRVDADMTVEAHPGLVEWLAGDPDPSVDAWMVELEAGIRWRLPLLVRGNLEWRYVSPVHTWLDTAGRKTRPLRGLTLHPHQDGARGRDPAKFEEHIRLLADGVKRGEGRAIFYTAEAHRFLGNTEQAICFYRARAKMGGWEEERWYASYQAAKLAGDVDGLLEVWNARPWRHEPLTEAARLVAAAGAREDVLFLEHAHTT